ncbi:MAG: calcium-translocating P-type ATPase, PMCA-type, partial [Bacteroidales bacterium]|nr:calcium-translocating P-type ATPase, PMCA-type [Bacteroidales bacterium]
FEPIGIFVAVMLSTGVGFYFEHRANRKFDILNQVNDEVQVKVIRSGRVQEIFRKDVVVGDVVMLEAGNEIPADGLLLDSLSLRVNESMLTGEPIVDKSHQEEYFDKEATYPTNRVLRGSTVMEGRGVMRVEAVGDQTEYGKVYTGSQIENNIQTPLNLQLEKLSGLITKISYWVAGIILAGRTAMLLLSPMEARYETWWQFGAEILNTLMVAVTVIVVTVPEGLPMSVVLSLALSMKRMLEDRNLVRKMHACETMGACTVICTDKTGTLTQNQMRVSEVWLSEEKVLLSNLLKENMAANSTAFLDDTDASKPKVIGNPTEGALLLWLREQGEDYEALRGSVTIEEQLPFSTERKYMATVVRSTLFPGKRLLYVKGAPEIVSGLCEMDGLLGPELENRLLSYQNRAMRTLGFAVADLLSEGSCFEEGRIKPGITLRFMGFAAISDPVRQDVPDAIQRCLQAGIDVKVVTGDTTATATEIARQVHLWKPEYGERNRITGPEFAALSDEELQERVGDLKIISRARPLDKERLVRALQKNGEVVAVTGDGTNDAPALNAAQVGLSMGDGTSVAKEASDITILDNAFGSIVSAVMWGRSLYQNVQRFILFQLTVNVVACLIVMLGALMDAEQPLTVTQMLWVNLIMDTFAAMALASLPPNPDVMNDKPRDIHAHILIKPMRRQIIGVGCVLFLVLFGLMQYFKFEEVVSLRDFSFGAFFRDFLRFDGLHLEREGISPVERSIFFTFFVMLQFWNMFNAKAFLSKRSAFHQLFGKGDGFLPVLLLILAGQLAIVHFGGEMFNVVRIGWENWLLIIASTSLVLWLGELLRLLFKRLHRQ